MNIKQLRESAKTLKRKWLWLIASSSLILIPLSFWLVGTVDTAFKKIVVFVAFLPIMFAVYSETEQTDNPEKGSPTGNAIAMILGMILLLGIVWVVFSLIKL